MRENRGIGRPCPACGKENDTASSLEKPELQPKPGDVSLCINCGLVEQFDDNLIQRAVTPAKFEALPRYLRAEIVKYKWALDRVRRERNRRN